MTEELRIIEFGFPGELRDRLVGAVLAGEKTATTGLLIEWELDDEPVPRLGEQLRVVDSQAAGGHGGWSPGGPVAAVNEVEDVAVGRWSGYWR